MKRGNKLLLLFLALVVAVGAWVLVTKLTPGEEIEEEPDATLVSVSADDIISLSWTANDKTINLEQSESGWVNADDAAFPVDQDSVNNLLGAVSDVKSKQTIAGVQDFSQYGLDKPAMTIAVGYKNGSRNVLELGNKNAVTSDYYLRLDTGADAQTVGSDIYDAFVVPLSDLIAKESIPTMDTPVGMRVVTGSGKLDLLYLQDSTGVAYSDLFHWFRKTDSGYRIANTYTILSFVDKIEALAWADVVSYEADEAALAQYGLSSPAAVLTIDYTASGEDDSTATNSFVLELGSYNSDGNCYVRLRGSSMVYLIDGATADSIVQMSANDLLPDEVCYMNMDELLELDILSSGETYHIDIDRDGTSTVYTWNGKQLDSGIISAFLNNLKNLKSSGSASAAGDGAGEALGITFYRDAGEYSEMTLRFLNYDSVNYLVDFNGAQTQLAARDVVDGIFSAIESVFKS